jgi:hypothetical protein
MSGVRLLVLGTRLRATSILLATAAACAMLVSASSARAESSNTPSGFGFASANVGVVPTPGVPATQAGSHPGELIVSIGLNSKENLPVGGEVRDLDVTLPPGLVGNPSGVPQCPQALLDTAFEAQCPENTQIGVVRVELGSGVGGIVTLEPHLFNIVPPPGVPAEFAMSLNGISAIFDASVGSRNEHYALKVDVRNITQRQIVAATTTIWNIPGEHVTGGATKPFLTMPTACGEQLRWHFAADTWESPGTFAETEAVMPAITGCEHLSFPPSLSVMPEEGRADTATGITAKLSVPAEGLLVPGGLAGANIRETIATLPVGMDVNPGQAAGLEFCSLAQANLDTPDRAPSCPPASRIGTDEIKTPLLTDTLKGEIYLLPSNPPNLEVLVAASGAGVNLKLIGYAHLAAATGQITATFPETPDLPVTSLFLRFSGGASASVYTPLACGGYTIDTSLSPWPSPLVPVLFDNSGFTISAGPNGASCAAPPFAPTLTAGATSHEAGEFTSFSVLLQRPDGQQRVSSVQTTLPKGFSGVIGNVQLCGEPAASAGTCPSSSQIGHMVAVAGPGNHPLTLPEPGQPQAPVYMTGPYGGAPFGLSIVVPVVAGPFNLGTVVVRARVNVDPTTAQITVTTDLSGPYAIPKIIDGVPVDLKDVEVVVDRPHFVFNPSNCAPTSVTAAVGSNEGATAAPASPFGIGGCARLPFKPAFNVSTAAKTSRVMGASLYAKVAFPKGSFDSGHGNTEANVASVKVDLPKQLPSRLSTLQKACLASTFDANPAACPVASRVGVVRAQTPVLPVPLTGPVYFVSHGGAAFPDLDVVLQGDGVRVDLVAATRIHNGITSSFFQHVPDVPVTSFELYFPEGPYSALAAFGNLCTSALAMPTAFTAQNGLVIRETTKIAVTGCPARSHRASVRHAKRARTAQARGSLRAGRASR